MKIASRDIGNVTWTGSESKSAGVTSLLQRGLESVKTKSVVEGFLEEKNQVELTENGIEKYPEETSSNKIQPLELLYEVFGNEATNYKKMTYCESIPARQFEANQLAAQCIEKANRQLGK